MNGVEMFVSVASERLGYVRTFYEQVVADCTIWYGDQAHLLLPSKAGILAKRMDKQVALSSSDRSWLIDHFCDGDLFY